MLENVGNLNVRISGELGFAGNSDDAFRWADIGYLEYIFLPGESWKTAPVGASKVQHRKIIPTLNLTREPCCKPACAGLHLLVARADIVGNRCIFRLIADPLAVVCVR